MENNNDVYYITRDYLRGLEIGRRSDCPSKSILEWSTCMQKNSSGRYIHICKVLDQT